MKKNNTTQTEDEKRYLSSGYKIGNAAATSGLVGYGLYRAGRYDRVKLAAKLSKFLRDRKNKIKISPSSYTKPTAITEKLEVKNANSTLGKSIQKTIKYAPGVGKTVLTGLGRLAEASHWTRKNWKHGGILGKGKVLAVGSILPGAVGVKQVALRQYYNNKDKKNGGVHNYQEFTPDQEELVRGRKFTQGHDAKKKAIAGGVIGTGLGAAGIYGAANLSKLPAKALKGSRGIIDSIAEFSDEVKASKRASGIDKGVANVFGPAAKITRRFIPDWLIKLAERKPKQAMRIQELFTGIDTRRYNKIAKVGSKMAAKWNRGLGGKAVVASAAMVPGVVLGGGSYAASKIMNGGTRVDGESKNKKHIIALSNIESSNGAETSRVRGSILGFRSNNPLNIAAGQVSGAFGGRSGAKAANKADLEGKGDETILREATRSGRLTGVVSGAALGTAAGALWAKERYRFDLSKLKSVLFRGLTGYTSTRALSKAIPGSEVASVGAGLVRGAKNALRTGERIGFVVPGYKNQAIKDAAIRGGIATAVAGGLAGDRAAYINTKSRLDARRNTEKDIAEGKTDAITYKAEARKKRLEKEENKKPIGKSILTGLGVAGGTSLGMSVLSDYSKNSDWLDKIERSYQKYRDSKVGNWLFGKDRRQQLENRIEDAGAWINKNWERPGITGKLKVLKFPVGLGVAGGTTYYVKKKRDNKKDLEYYRNLEKHYDNIKTKDIQRKGSGRHS